MTKKIIRTSDAPNSTVYSQAVQAGSMIFVSGMTGIDPKTTHLAGNTIQEQTRQALKNCAAILDAAGSSLADVVKVTVLLTKPEDFAGLNEEYANFFPHDPPARSVTKLGVDIPNLLVSIKMTAIQSPP